MEDRTLLSSFLVSTTSFGGPGSLRQAILDSNAATSQTNVIEFDIPGEGVQTIVPLAPLPAITHAVLIDGWSQPDYAGTPLIELDGSQAGTGDVLTITGSGVTVRGLDIQGVYPGAGIHLTGTGATGNWICGNFIGTDPTGTQAAPNNDGVLIDNGASGNIIGTDGDGIDDEAKRNLISGNWDVGVEITGLNAGGNVVADTNGNVVAGNFIGTDVTGTLPLGNGGWGVALQGTSSNRVGLVPHDGMTDVIRGNLISSNAWYDSVTVAAGVYITAGNGNAVGGNEIGTDVSGTAALPNYGTGIKFDRHSSHNTIGGTAVGAGNLIANNNGTGVVVLGDDSVGNRISSNRIFANGLIPTPTPQGSLGFGSDGDVVLPNDLIREFEANETIEAWFQTSYGGVILGYQDQAAYSSYPQSRRTYVPALYVGSDGMLYGELWNGDTDPISSGFAVTDGQWHHVALVADGESQLESLYVDGQWAGSLEGPVEDIGGSFNQIGNGYNWPWPAGGGNWTPFNGQIDDVRIWSMARSADEVQQDMTTGLSGTEPGLQAYYRFDESQGITVHDSSPNHRDATLEVGWNNTLPTWANGGLAIDLGDDGITSNVATPRQGPNGLPNFPIVVTRDGRLQGWLGGGTARTQFHLVS
jgi:hypothetical protein